MLGSSYFGGKVYTKKRPAKHLEVLEIGRLVLMDSIAMGGVGNGRGNLVVLEFKRVLLSAGGVGGVVGGTEGVGLCDTSALQLHVDQGPDDDQPVGDVTDHRAD